MQAASPLVFQNPVSFELGITFTGVVPICALIAYIVVKIHRRRKRSHQQDSPFPMKKSNRENDGQMMIYMQQKAELEADQTRYEMHAEKIQREAPPDNAIVELPAEVKLNEMEGPPMLPELSAGGSWKDFEAVLEQYELEV